MPPTAKAVGFALSHSTATTRPAASEVGSYPDAGAFRTHYNRTGCLAPRLWRPRLALSQPRTRHHQSVGLVLAANARGGRGSTGGPSSVSPAPKVRPQGSEGWVLNLKRKFLKKLCRVQFIVDFDPLRDPKPPVGFAPIAGRIAIPPPA